MKAGRNKIKVTAVTFLVTFFLHLQFYNEMDCGARIKGRGHSGVPNTETIPCTNHIVYKIKKIPIPHL